MKDLEKLKEQYKKLGEEIDKLEKQRIVQIYFDIDEDGNLVVRVDRYVFPGMPNKIELFDETVFDNTITDTLLKIDKNTGIILYEDENLVKKIFNSSDRIKIDLFPNIIWKGYHYVLEPSMSGKNIILKNSDVSRGNICLFSKSGISYCNYCYVENIMTTEVSRTPISIKRLDRYSIKTLRHIIKQLIAKKGE